MLLIRSQNLQSFVSALIVQFSFAELAGLLSVERTTRMPKLNMSTMSSVSSPVKLGKMVSSDELGVALHETAAHGDKKRLKKILKTGV